MSCRVIHMNTAADITPADIAAAIAIIEKGNARSADNARWTARRVAELGSIEAYAAEMVRSSRRMQADIARHGSH